MSNLNFTSSEAVESWLNVSDTASQTIDIDIPDLKWGGNCSIPLPKIGGRCYWNKFYLVLEINPLIDGDYRFSDVLGHACIERAAFGCKNETFEVLTGELMEILSETFACKGGKNEVDSCILRSPDENQLKQWSFEGNSFCKGGDPIIRLYINLPFFFTHEKSGAFPAFRVTNDELHLDLYLREFKRLLHLKRNSAGEGSFVPGKNDKGGIKSAKLVIRTTHMPVRADPMSRYEIKYKYIAMHIEHMNGTNRNVVRLPIGGKTACFWFFIRSNHRNNEHFNWALIGGQHPLVSASITINNKYLENARDAQFYNSVIPKEVFGGPFSRQLYAYSFVRDPLSEFCSDIGALNSSRINEISLELELKDETNIRDPSNTVVIAYWTFNTGHFNDGKFGWIYAHGNIDVNSETVIIS